MKIIIDTNMLLAQARFKIDVLEDVKQYGEPVVLDVVQKELETIASKNLRGSRHAKLILEILNMKNIKQIKIHTKTTNTDNTILITAQKNKWAVATNDKKLIKRLKENKIRIIRLRQKKYLVME